MSIFQYNGGSAVGMRGQSCVGIAVDRRFGKQRHFITNHFQRVFKIQDNIIMSLTGLGTDVQTFAAIMEEKVNLYRLKENKDIKPSTFINLVAYTLFERRFGSYMVQPIVAGLQGNKPVLASYDSIGAQSDLQPFQCTGTGAQNLISLSENLQREDLTEDQLHNALYETITAGCDRDAYSGWGTIVYTIGESGLRTKFYDTKQS